MPVALRKSIPKEMNQVAMVIAEEMEFRKLRRCTIILVILLWKWANLKEMAVLMIGGSELAHLALEVVSGQKQDMRNKETFSNKNNVNASDQLY